MCAGLPVIFSGFNLIYSTCDIFCQAGAICTSSCYVVAFVAHMFSSVLSACTCSYEHQFGGAWNEKFMLRHGTIFQQTLAHEFACQLEHEHECLV